MLDGCCDDVVIGVGFKVNLICRSEMRFNPPAVNFEVSVPIEVPCGGVGVNVQVNFTQSVGEGYLGKLLGL